MNNKSKYWATVTYQYLCPAHRNTCVLVNKTAHTVLQFSTPALLILRTLGAWDLVSGTRLLRNVFLRIIHCEKHLGHSTHFLQALCMSKTAKWTLQFHRIKIQFKCLTILLNSWTINWCRGAQFGVETFTRTQKIKCYVQNVMGEIPIKRPVEHMPFCNVETKPAPLEISSADILPKPHGHKTCQKILLPSASVSIWHIFWYWRVSVEKWPKDMFSETLSAILGDNKCEGSLLNICWKDNFPMTNDQIFKTARRWYRPPKIHYQSGYDPHTLQFLFP